MTVREACSILGVSPGDSLAEIKRKYHQLAIETHPDQLAGEIQDHRSIAAVNEAYDLLVKKGAYQAEHIGTDEKEHAASGFCLRAPLSPNAYTERNVYQYAEDTDGNVIGAFVIARGKYCWDPEEEDFTLFQKSILEAAMELMTAKERKRGCQINEGLRFRIIKELVYLLSGQFTDLSSGLEVLADKTSTDTQGIKIYYFQATLEFAAYVKICGKDQAQAFVRTQSQIKTQSQVKSQEILVPVKLADHRLYIGRNKQEQLGYLSFRDDRLYYVLIPMFENKEVQIKIQAAEDQTQGRRGRAAECIKLHLWVRKLPVINAVTADVNQKIERLLLQ